MASTAAFHVRSGCVVGRNHLLDGRNCQDALQHSAFAVNGRPYSVGVIADGCGEGAHSEVGAQLAVQFIPREVRRLLEEGVPSEEIPGALFKRVVGFLQSIVDACSFADTHDYVTFVQHHLLFTIIGFIISPEEARIFAAGDGLLIMNDEIHCREQDNAPTYIGYHLIDRHHLYPNASPLPDTFDEYTLPIVELNHLTIGSDAWFQERPLLDQIWDTRTLTALQLRLNRWSNERHFKDDASLIVVERTTLDERGQN